MSDNFDNNNEFNPFGGENTETPENREAEEQPASVHNDGKTEFTGEYHYTSDQINQADNAKQKAAEPEQPAAQTYVPYEWNNSQQSGNYQQQYQNPQYQQPQYQQGDYPPPPKKSGTGKIVAIVVLVIAAVLAVLGLIFGSLTAKPKPEKVETTEEYVTDGAAETTAQQPNVQAPVETAPAPPEKTELSAVEVAEKARKSVVGVMTYRNGQLSGEGSGVVMGLDQSGEYTYIITCAHVINESDVTYGILTLDGRTFEAQLVATDTRTDIGVLTVKTTELPIAEFADSSKLRVGETVYAIGNPGGSAYFGSMTDGIISAIDRSVNATYNLTCIQHNAAINPGNSGGALVNSAGQVIGINSSKIAATDYEGMGFAIPMATVNSIVSDLIKYKYVPNRPKLGIEYDTVDRYQLYSMVVAMRGLPAGSLVIAGISNDSTLANTKAQVGDLIIGVNGKPMNNSNVLLDLIDTGAVGDALTLNLCRIDNRTYKITKFDVTITLIEDKGDLDKEEPTTSAGEYNHGGASSFEDFFNDYFGGFGGFGK